LSPANIAFARHEVAQFRTAPGCSCRGCELFHSHPFDPSTSLGESKSSLVSSGVNDLFE
jgi:hypothetical protein